MPLASVRNSIVMLRPLNSVRSTVAGCHSAVFWRRWSLNSPSTRQLNRTPSGAGDAFCGMPSEMPVEKRSKIRSPGAALGSWIWVAASVGFPMTFGWRKRAFRRRPRLMAGFRTSIDGLPAGSDDASPGRRGACQRTSAKTGCTPINTDAMQEGNRYEQKRCIIAIHSLSVTDGIVPVVDVRHPACYVTYAGS